jgi:hypothetical protein
MESQDLVRRLESITEFDTSIYKNGLCTMVAKSPDLVCLLSGSDIKIKHSQLFLEHDPVNYLDEQLEAQRKYQAVLEPVVQRGYTSLNRSLDMESNFLRASQFAPQDVLNFGIKIAKAIASVYLWFKGESLKKIIASCVKEDNITYMQYSVIQYALDYGKEFYSKCLKMYDAPEEIKTRLQACAQASVDLAFIGANLARTAQREYECDKRFFELFYPGEKVEVETNIIEVKAEEKK